MNSSNLNNRHLSTHIANEKLDKPVEIDEKKGSKSNSGRPKPVKRIEQSLFRKKAQVKEKEEEGPKEEEKKPSESSRVEKLI